MHENALAEANRLSDEALLARLKLLARNERDATVELIAHLAALDGRSVHIGDGSGSLYTYCRDVLGYSEDAAWNRAATANVVRRYPVALAWLADGSLNVTTVRILRRVLTPENHVAVLSEARHRSKKDVELIEARLNPKPDVPSTIRKVVGAAATSAPPSLALLSDPPASPEAAPTPVSSPPATLPIAVVAQRPEIRPLTPVRYRLQLTVSKETHDRLRRMQNLLCREIPDGDPAAIFERSLELLERQVERKKLAAARKPRTPRPPKEGTRDIPPDVRRTVWSRDGGQCAFRGRTGRCPQRRYLEWHHIHPHGHQGKATVENISLRCRAHNVYESEQVFGRFEPFQNGSREHRGKAGP